MYARATSGDKLNNNKFSSCSINNISAVLLKKRDDCFVGMLFFHFFPPVAESDIVSSRCCACGCAESWQPICGNGLVEAGEECDCGYSDQCKDLCCYSANEAEGKRCKLQPGQICRCVMMFFKIRFSKYWCQCGSLVNLWFVIVMLQSQPRALLHRGMLV